MAFVAIVSLALAGASCSRSSDETVVLYVSADEHFARLVVTQFEQETGIDVSMVTDTEVKKTTGLVERLRAERANPLADVFWSSEVFMTIELADDGVLEKHTSVATTDWPAELRDKEGRWYGFASRARVIVYSPDRVAPDDVPQTWMELTNQRFAGRVVMADPRFGTTGGHLGVMKAYWTGLGIAGYYEAFIEGLTENKTRLLTSGNAGVVEAVARGEADLGMTDTDDCWVAKKHGHNIDWVYARHSAGEDLGGGTLLIPNTVARVKGGPNPANAAKLIDFLLSAKVERMLAESDSHNIPTRPELADEFPELAVPNPLRVSLQRAALMRKEAVEQAMRIAHGPTETARMPRDEEAAAREDEALDPNHAP